MKKYYVHDGQNELGPVDFEQLKSISIDSTTLVWHEGLENWTTASNIPELGDLITIKRTPPPLVSVLPQENTIASEIQELSFIEPNQKHSIYNLKNPYITGGFVIACGIVALLFYQDNKNSKVLGSLKAQVVMQEQAISAQRIEASNIEAELEQKEVELKRKEATEKRKEADRERINYEIIKRKMNFRNSWEDYIKIENNEPPVNYILGGIGAFRIYMRNESDYMLDQVNIMIQYIRKNGKVYKTETISMFNIPAGSIENGIAPESKNGVKVKVNIEKIISREAHFCYPSYNGNSGDPYFCN